MKTSEDIREELLQKLNKSFDVILPEGSPMGTMLCAELEEYINHLCNAYYNDGWRDCSAEIDKRYTGIVMRVHEVADCPKNDYVSVLLKSGERVDCYRFDVHEEIDRRDWPK